MVAYSPVIFRADESAPWFHPSVGPVAFLEGGRAEDHILEFQFPEGEAAVNPFPVAVVFQGAFNVSPQRVVEISHGENSARACGDERVSEEIHCLNSSSPPF